MAKKQSKYINIANFLDDTYRTTFVLGARGVGKTIGAFKYMIDNFKKSGVMGMYMRRYQIEIERSGIDLELLSKLTETEVTRDNVAIDNVVYDFILVDGEPAIYLVDLNGVGKYKSSSFSNVDIIIYDEFIDLKNRELKNETNTFTQFAMTVFRDFRKYRALFLANNTNVFNCYFLDFEVLPRSRVTKFRNEQIKIITYETSTELDDERNNTALAKLVYKLEGFDNSSLANKASGNYEDFIRKLPKNAKYGETLKLNGKEFGLYSTSNKFYISSKFDPQFKHRSAMTYEDVDEQTTIMDYDRYTLLKSMFLNSNCYFTDVKTRSLFIKRFKKFSFLGSV